MTALIRDEFDLAPGSGESVDYLVVVDYVDDHGRVVAPQEPVEVRRYDREWTADTPIDERTSVVVWSTLPRVVQEHIHSHMTERAGELERERAAEYDRSYEAARDAHFESVLDAQRGK